MNHIIMSQSQDLLERIVCAFPERAINQSAMFPLMTPDTERYFSLDTYDPLWLYRIGYKRGAWYYLPTTLRRIFDEVRGES